MMRFFLLIRIALLVSLLALVRCLPVDTGIEFEDAFSELYAAIDYKSRECGQQPPVMLIPPKKVKEYGLRLCSISIIRQPCPFNEYPLFCTEMFLDLPGIGP
jgi:hypothetical protein